jgi:hypothetical protein
VGCGMAHSLTDRCDDRIAGVLSCYDRLLITGTVPVICYAEGMTRFLYANGVRIFDYPQFAQTLRDRVRDCAASLATTAGITIEHISKSYIRKEEVVGRVLERRGDHPGLVHIISAMEACDSYRPWHDKANGKTFVRPDSGKCLHYYFYFIDAMLGLIYLRVPTWCPFRLQFYCKRPWLPGAANDRGRHRLQYGRHCLSADRRLASCSRFGRHILTRVASSYPRSLCRPVLPGI